MAPEKTYSQYEILAIIKQIDNENFILANAARMVFFAGFHKNEIEKIKVKNVFKNDTVLSQIDPFLKNSRKAYTSEPIFLDQWPRMIFRSHIIKLGEGGYETDQEGYVFPDPRTKNQYGTKKLWRHFNKYFKNIDFDGLRKLGIEREELRLKVMYRHSQRFRENKLLKYSRHSRLTTTAQFITGKIQAVGNQKKGDSPWEIIVKMIERIPHYKKAPKKICADVIEKIINNRFEEDDIKKSLVQRNFANKMKKRKESVIPNTINISDKTWIELEQEPCFQKFMTEYIDLLKNNLQMVEVRGHAKNSYYYTCGQMHDRQNLSWHPFKLLTRICKKYDYDPLIAIDIIEDRIRKRLECECQIIDNQSQNRRNGLIDNFGADLGGTGRQDFGIF